MSMTRKEWQGELAKIATRHHLSAEARREIRGFFNTVLQQERDEAEKVRKKLTEIITNSKGSWDAHCIDIVVRRDGREERYEGDFLKTFARNEK